MITKSCLIETATLLDDFGIKNYTIPKYINTNSELMRWRKDVINNHLENYKVVPVRSKRRTNVYSTRKR